MYIEMKGKKTYKRKFIRKRKGRATGNGSTVTKFPLFNQPTTRSVTLKYVDRFSMDPSGIGAVRKTYISNSPYRPDGINAHSAMGTDEMIEIFQSFYVVSATIKVSCVGSGVTGTDNTSNIVSVYSVGTKNPPAIDIIQIMEQSRVKWKIIPSSINIKPTNIYENYNAAKLWGYKDVADADALHATFDQTNGYQPPAELSYFHVQCDSFFTSEDTYPTDIVVEILYRCVFNQTQQINSSTL